MGEGKHRDQYMYFLFFHRSSRGDQRNSLRKTWPVFLAWKTEERAHGAQETSMSRSHPGCRLSPGSSRRRHPC